MMMKVSASVVVLVAGLVGVVHASSFGLDYGLSQGPDAVHATTGAELVEPTVVSSSGGTLDSLLVMDQYYYGGAIVEFWTRALNGSIPAPTFRIKRGDTWHLTLINNMLPQPYANTGHNQHKDPNTTNIHTHGLHVSGEGTEDNVFVEVLPGESFTYTYNIPCNQRGGTHWYHPHHHGSTALQVGGGAAGAIIVEDETGEIPSDWEALPEKLWVIQHMLLEGDMNTFENAFASGSAIAREVAVSHSNVRDFMLVNGQYQPTMSITTGQWYRVRIVFAGQSNFAKLQLSDTTSCTMNILAKDGIYVSDAPRTGIPAMILAPGSRVDVALACWTAGTYTIQGGAGARRRLRKEHGRSAMGPPPGPGAGAGGGGAGLEWVGDFMTLTVTGATATQTSLSAFTPANYRANYFPDLTSATADQSVSLALQGGARALNGVSFINSDTSNALFTFTIGQIQQWAVTGTNAHPWHLHINPFQLITINNDENGYYQVGDYHDVFLNPSGDGSLTARSVTDLFTGHQVMHCHILAHEDEGMMGFAQISGTEGTAYGGSTGCAASPSPSGTPSVSPTISESPTVSVSVSDTATGSVSVSSTPTVSVSNTGTPTVSESNTGTPSVSASNTGTPTVSETGTASPTEGLSATSTPTQSATGTATGTQTPTVSVTGTPVAMGNSVVGKTAKFENVDYTYLQSNPSALASIIADFKSDIQNADSSISEVRVTGTSQGSLIIDYEVIVPTGSEATVSSLIDSGISAGLVSTTITNIPTAALEDTSASVTASSVSSDDTSDDDDNTTLIIIIVVVVVVVFAVIAAIACGCKSGKKKTSATGSAATSDVTA